MQVVQFYFKVSNKHLPQKANYSIFWSVQVTGNNSSNNFYSLVTSIKLGVMEDHSNRTRLAKLLRFYSSNSDKEMTSLAEYVERMKEKQDAIYFMAGTNRKEVRFEIIHTRNVLVAPWSSKR